jgi:hypothetical protein
VAQWLKRLWRQALLPRRSPGRPLRRRRAGGKRHGDGQPRPFALSFNGTP